MAVKLEISDDEFDEIIEALGSRIGAYEYIAGINTDKGPGRYYLKRISELKRFRYALCEQQKKKPR